ncbi:MAG TPA: triple tyrosine motif-containing protein, partial [Bacteroidia bacterium]|nr:triple tyrosine motif-containing protein [Bacteroidia bacterium]
YVEPDGITWLSSGSFILRYNNKIKPPTDIPFNAIISQVAIGKDSVIFWGSDNINFTREEAIPYQFNSIAFKFSAPYFEFDGETDYFYKLDGFDSTWYATKINSGKSYTNLPEGTYTFRVKMINLFNRSSNEASYTFTILPPWYRTGLAYFLYSLGFIFIILISVRLAVRRIRLQKEKLEIIVKERTAEVVEQKQQIELQNEKLEDAYKGIQDSIHYAERIQHAILPVASEIYNSFPDSFVLFRPRDIVSGDFYWFVKRGNLTWIACVDCTGHGVPGAFMSMIGNTLLNEIVLEKNIELPDKILNLLHIRIRQALRQDVGGETRDGMDISLCLVDSQRKKLFYAGANRGMWLMRKNELHL